MKKIETIIIESDYKKINKYTYKKDKGRYISVIKISNVGNKYLDFSLSIIYYGIEIQTLNEKRKISKLQTHIKSLLNNISLKNCPIDHYHVEIGCYYKKENSGDIENLYEIVENIKELICLKNFTDVDGLFDIHGVENGRCFRIIGKKNAHKLHKHLKQNKRILKIIEKYQDEYELIFYHPFLQKIKSNN